MFETFLKKRKCRVMLKDLGYVNNASTNELMGQLIELVGLDGLEKVCETGFYAAYGRSLKERDLDIPPMHRGNKAGARELISHSPQIIKTAGYDNLFVVGRLAKEDYYATSALLEEMPKLTEKIGSAGFKKFADTCAHLAHVDRYGTSAKHLINKSLELIDVVGCDGLLAVGEIAILKNIIDGKDAVKHFLENSQRLAKEKGPGHLEKIANDYAEVLKTHKGKWRYKEYY